MLQRVFTRVSKGVARYSPRGSAAEHCSACRFFMTGGDCARVLGKVLPQGWCKYFSREAVQRWNPLWPMEGIPAPPGATLDLSFLTSGALDPRITFTRASTATYFNYAGVMQTAATNAPRWDYNPSTLALQGLLIEEARTNVVLNSGDPSAATWNAGTSTLTGHQATAPDGTTNAARVAYIASAGGSTCVVAPIVSFTGTAAPYTMSVWLRGNVGGEQVYLSMTPDAGLYYRALCTLTTSWQRFVLTTPNLTAVSWFPQIGRDGRDASQAATPAQTVFMWGGQLEQGAFPTSYIPTAAAAVTRSQDICTMPIAAWFNSSTATLMAEAYLPVVPANAITGFGDGATFGNSFYLTENAGSGTAIRGGLGSAASVTLNAAAVNKIAGSNTATQVTCCTNGGAVGSGAQAAGGLAAATELVFGAGPWSPTAGTSQFDGHLRRVSYWPRVLTNAEMQQVTT